MNSKPCRPHWTSLNVILAASIGLLALESQVQLTPLGDKVALAAIVLLMYGLMATWVTANAAALDEDGGQPAPPQAMPRAETSGAGVQRRRDDQLADGVLSADR